MQVQKLLSSSSTANLEIDSIYDGIDFTSITRAKFESLVCLSSKKSLEPVSKVLQDFKSCAKSEIDEIVLVG